MALRGNPRTARALNRRLILDLLRQQGAVSRVELANETGLSAAAVTFVTTELIEEGLLIERKPVKGSVGRRPVPLEIDYEARISIGLKVSNISVSGVVTNLAAKSIAEIEIPLSKTSPEAVIEVSARVVNALLEKVGEGRERLIGIGLILSGQVDAEKGVSRQMQRFGWTDAPIARMLADTVSAPVWVDNDANAFAVSQHLFGHGRGCRNLVAVAMGRGVGAGFVFDGRLYRGSGGAAGEFGHNFEERGRMCECGRDGCLETYCADVGLVKSWNLLDPKAKGGDTDDLLDAANSGDAAAKSVLHDAGTRLGHHVANLANTVDPDLIVFGGYGARFGEHLFSAVRDALAEFTYAKPPKLAFDEGENAWSQGAAALAVNHFYNFEVTGGYAPKLNKYSGINRVA